MPAKFVTILKALYHSTSGRGRVYGRLPAPFSISTDVRQGCPISPFLFNVVIDDIMKAALDSGAEGVELPTGSLSDLDYVDNIA